MNYLKYDAIVPGSNDFNLGDQKLKKLAQTAQFPLLACNIFNLGSNNYYLRPFTIISKKGVNFGILGVTSKSAEQNDDSTKVSNVEFKNEIKFARNTVVKLRNETDGKNDILLFFSDI